MCVCVRLVEHHNEGACYVCVFFVLFFVGTSFGISDLEFLWSDFTWTLPLFFGVFCLYVYFGGQPSVGLHVSKTVDF